MKKETKKSLKFLSIVFACFFLFHNLILKIRGFPNRFSPTPSEGAMTWREVFYDLPITFGVALTLTVLVHFIGRAGWKQAKNEEEAIRKRIAERNRKRLEKRNRAKKTAEKINLLKLDAYLLNVPAYEDDSGVVNRAFQLYRYKKNIFGEALRASKK